MIYQMNSGSTMNEAHCPREGKNDVVADLEEFEGRSKDDGPDLRFTLRDRSRQVVEVDGLLQNRERGKSEKTKPASTMSEGCSSICVDSSG
jgi:hypothetical protein